MASETRGHVDEVVSCVLKVASFCSYYSQLCNVHTVDFVVGEKWDQLSSNLRTELSVLNFKQLRSLVDTGVSSFLSERDTPHLFRFITMAKVHTLEALNICSSMTAISASFSKRNASKNFHYWCMSPKKSHEVEVLASVISSLAEDKGVKVVVDVGSGKGYLSSYLALEHRLNVLAVDSSSSNTSGAIERNKKVVYYRNKSHQKKKHEMTNIKSDTSSAAHSFSQNDDAVHCDRSHESPPPDCREDSSLVLDSPGGLFIPRTHNISASCNLNYLIKDFLHVLKEKNVTSLTDVTFDSGVNQEPMEDQTLLCSLHSCGNLSASLLKLFVSTNQAKILCSVGCCYHLVEEKFFKSPFATDGAKGEQEFGFPLSSVLLKQKYSLGRNARMLASQSIDRLSEGEVEPKKALYYRAVLEVILRDKLGISRDYTVGRIADKCSGFVQYVRRALRELKLDHLQLSESEIEQYLVKYSEEEKKLYALQQLRIVMAPCIEALILLDRLLFLLEQEAVKEAHLVRLFDPVISPRCYGIVAWK